MKSKQGTQRLNHRRRSQNIRRKRSYHHGDLRRTLVDAAVWLVEKGGAQALTLRAAARRAGVSQAAPYRHFKNKEALLAAVAEEGFRAMAVAMRRASAGGKGEREQMRALGLGYVEFATSHPSHFRVMFGREMADRSAYPSLREAAVKTFQMLVEIISDCQRVHIVRAGQPEELALTAWAIVHGISALLVDDQLARLFHKPGNELADIVTRNLLLGLAPRA